MEKIDDEKLDDLEVVASRLGVPDDWDVLIYGDGSGNPDHKPCGWGWALVDRQSRRRKAEFGALSCGTIIVAELMPVVHAMLWYGECLGRMRPAELGRPVNVHVITDNQTVVAYWKALSGGGRVTAKIRRRRPLWNVLLGYEQLGYVFDFHWTKRNQIGLHNFTDRDSKRARKDLIGVWEEARRLETRDRSRELHALNASAG